MIEKTYPHIIPVNLTKDDKALIEKVAGIKERPEAWVIRRAIRKFWGPYYSDKDKD